MRLCNSCTELPGWEVFLRMRKFFGTSFLEFWILAPLICESWLEKGGVVRILLKIWTIDFGVDLWLCIRRYADYTRYLLTYAQNLWFFEKIGVRNFLNVFMYGNNESWITRGVWVKKNWVFSIADFLKCSFFDCLLPRLLIFWIVHFLNCLLPQLLIASIAHSINCSFLRLLVFSIVHFLDCSCSLEKWAIMRSGVFTLRHFH